MGILDRLFGPQMRASYARTNADFLVNEPDGFPSRFPPVWWMGSDAGGGGLPIGPNGPYESVGDYEFYRDGNAPSGWFAPAIPAVIRATALITGPLTAAPFGVKDDTGARRPQPRPRWLTDPMLMRPDARVIPGQVHPEVLQLPRGNFWVEWLRSAIWWGLGAFICSTDATGAPIAGTLKVVNPGVLATERGPEGGLRWVLEPNAEDRVGRVVFDRDGFVSIGDVTYRIVVLRNPHSPVDPEGMSAGVFAMSPGTFGLGSQLARYQSGQFRAGVPNGYLKVNAPDLSPTEAENLRTSWLRRHGGDRRSIAVLNSTTDFEPVNLSPVDSALDEVKRLNLADTAFAFGLDPATLGATIGNTNTYQNIRDAWQNHKDFGLALWISAVQDTLSALLPSGQSVAVSLDGVANPSMKDRYDAYTVALKAGILTLEEVRALEALPPRPDAAAESTETPPPDAPDGPQSADQTAADPDTPPDDPSATESE